MIRHNYNRKLGYYQVGGDEFETKAQALLAVKSDQHPDFVFNNDVFNRVNWTTEPEQELTELYRQRAQQLRDKHDWLILSYSGGSDSDNILDTFISYGIHLDEIITRWPVALLNNLTPDANKYDHEYIWNEWFFCVEPRLKWIKQNHPHIKITVHDWSEGADTWKIKDGWQLKRSGCWVPEINDRQKLIGSTDSFDKHRNIGYILGLEKPRVCYKDNNFYLYFLDFVVGQTLDQDEAYTLGDWEVEYFYWSPECVPLIKKQAHIIKNFFVNNLMFLPYITWPISHPNSRKFYETTVRALIYPTWNSNNYQVVKTANSEIMVQDSPIVNFVNKDIIKDWQGSLDEFKSIIDPKYLQDNKIIGFISDFYQL
jgi:hypothetical protein